MGSERTSPEPLHQAGEPVAEDGKLLPEVNLSGLLHQTLAGWDILPSDILESMVELGFLALRGIGSPTDEQVSKDIDRAAQIAKAVASQARMESGGDRLGIYTGLALLKMISLAAREKEKIQGLREGS